MKQNKVNLCHVIIISENVKFKQSAKVNLQNIMMFEKNAFEVKTRKQL